MKPHRAAWRFARLVACHGDFLDLIDPVDDADRDARVKDAFRKVEKAVARTLKIKLRDTRTLSKAAQRAVPKKHRAKLLKKLNALSDAETDCLSVREQAAYLIGRAMGQRLGRLS